MKVAITGRIQTGSYTNRDGNKVYTTDVVVEEHEFCESKMSSSGQGRPAPADANAEGFMNIPDNISTNDLPFK